MNQNNFQPKKLRNAPVTILTEILKEKAKLDKNLVKKNNAHLRSFHDTFIEEMKKRDKLFASLYQCTYYTGSYYSNLRVSKPDEYDLNLLLKLPFKAENISVEYEQQVPSYVKYSITNETVTREKGLVTLFENGFLIPDKVRSWFQSVVDKALDTYQCPKMFAQVKCSSSKPARTIILVKKDGTQIDIDFVPVIECSMNMKPPGIDSGVFEKFLGNQQVPEENITGKKARRRRAELRCRRFDVRCFLVPKPYKPSEEAPVDDTECSYLWRAHYPKAEESVFFGAHGCEKALIRLLKLLRDKENWDILASYYLKTIVMWMILEYPREADWNMKFLGKRFLEALKNLQSYVERRNIPYFFDSSCNLLEKLSEVQASNIQNRLVTIIRDIKSDIENLWNVFDCPRTFPVGYRIINNSRNNL